ncbi:MAG: transcriptional repressor LexA [Dehalococcoidia bacterium]|nr:transcriptional repressor LexA [Dehalococcoidia bacterium]
MKKLSPRQQKILAFLHSFIIDNGYPPSIRDICKGCGISSTSVADYNLNALEQQGCIRRDPDVSRGIELVNVEREKPRLVRVPMIGQIAAGEPIPVLTADNWIVNEGNDFLDLTEDLTRGRENLYALKVKGTSMIDALINDGDLVIMQHAVSAENGEMVAAWMKDEKEITLKRFYHEGPMVRLQPANSQMAPIYVDADKVEVQGKVIGVIRQIS